MKKLLMPLFPFFVCASLLAQNNDELITACYKGDFEAVKKNVEGGADVKYKNPQGQTPISLCYFYPAITEYLISKGADVNDGDAPALVSASRWYSLEVMKMLLKAGADPNKPSVVKVDLAAGVRKALEDEKAKGKKANKYLVKAYEDQLKTMGSATTITTYALQNAIGSTNCTECIELLLNAGAKDYSNQIFGGNAFHEVAYSYAPAAQRALNIPAMITYFEGAGIAVPDWYRNLDVYPMGNVGQVVKLLKDKGINIEAPDNNKRTPLTAAILQPAPYEEVVMAFVDNGASVKATGKTLDPTEFSNETADPEKIKVRFDFPREGRTSKGSGYSANMELLDPKPKKVALISYYLYDPGKGKSKTTSTSNTGGGFTTTTTTASASVWRTSDRDGQQQVDGFYSKTIEALKSSFKENGMDLLTPEEFIDTDEKAEFYYGFVQETAKKEKTEIKRGAIAGIGSIALASESTLKVAPAGKGYRCFFIANEGEEESVLSNFQGGIFTSNRKLTSSLGFELAKGLGVDAVVVVYICTRKPKQHKNEFGVNSVVTMMLGPNPGRAEESDPEAKNLGQFYCGTRTFYNSPVIFKDDLIILGQYEGMANILKLHAAKMGMYINGKEKDPEN